MNKLKTLGVRYKDFMSRWWWVGYNWRFLFLDFEVAPIETTAFVLTYDEAVLYCFCLNVDDKTGWRMPTRQEVVDSGIDHRLFVPWYSEAINPIAMLPSSVRSVSEQFAANGKYAKGGETMKLSLLKEILTHDEIYKVPTEFEVTVTVNGIDIRLIEIVEKPESIELVDNNYNHYTANWDSEYEVSIIKRVEYYIGE